MIKKLIYCALNSRSDRLYAKKLRSLLKDKVLKKSEPNLQKEYIDYWNKKNVKADRLYYSLYSSISGDPSYKYVPENLYYKDIEPSLNNKSMLKAYSNKNLYQKMYKKDLLFPKIYARSINGIFYTSENKFCDNLEKLINDESPKDFIIKIAMDSGGGRGVELFAKKGQGYISNNNFIFDQTKLISRFGQDFVIQEYIKQNNFFNRFNETSLNTIRVFTYRSVTNEQIHVLHSILRIGRPGSIVDNQASGGICGIQNKKLNSFAIDKKGVHYLKSGSYMFEEKAEIPFYDNLIVEAKSIAEQNPYARILGLDFCIDSADNVRLIEVNNLNNEINFYQMNNGPLFGEFTDEIIDWCQKQPKTICLDFSILLKSPHIKK